MSAQNENEQEKKDFSSEPDSSNEEPEDVLGYQIKEEEEPSALEDIGIDTSIEEPATVLGFDISAGAESFDNTLSAKPQGDTNSDDIVKLKLEAIQKQLDFLSSEFQSKLKNDESKEKIIDSLHQELQEYKNNIIQKQLLSMVMDTIKIVDDVRKITNHYRLQEPATNDPVKLLDILESIPADLEDLFLLHGVKPFACDGELFDPSQQKVLNKIDTQDETKDKKVAERHRPGYKMEEKVVRPEIVDVYVYTDTSAE